MKRHWIGFLCGALLIGGCNSHSAPTTSTASAKGDEVCKVADEKLAKAAAEPSTPAPTPAAEPSKEVVTYGPAQKLSASDTVPVSKVVTAPEQYKDKYVRLTGKVTAVCPKRGCWLRVAPDTTAAAGNDVFIKFRDPPEGRLVPMDAVGHEATVEGTVKVGMMSEAMARHFKEDAGAPQEEIEKIVGPQKQVMIAGPAVSIEGIKPAE